MIEMAWHDPDRPAGRWTLRMPAWTPGSYMIRDPARHVVGLTAHRAGVPLTAAWTGKDRWEVDHPQSGPLTVTYRVFAHDLSVRESFLDDEFGLLLGTSLFLRMEGEDGPQRVTIHHPPAWQLLTALSPEPGTDASFVAPDYDALVDAPIYVGPARVDSFVAGGADHRIVLVGSGNENLDRIRSDLDAVVRAAHDLFGPPPYACYTFFLVLSDRRGGGLEHRDSTCIIYPRFGFEPRTEYRKFLVLCAHEFFHTWNVKRIRPVELGPFDYQSEVYTDLLWAMEGLTSYYAELLCLRAGCFGPAVFLERLAEAIRDLDATPGRLMMSLAAASRLAWIKHYRPDASAPSTQVSYYLKGMLVGLCLDLFIRARTAGARSLDHVMRGLWEHQQSTGAGVTYARWVHLAEHATGLNLAEVLETWVRQPGELPFESLLAPFGLRLVRAASPPGKADSDPDGGGYLGARIQVQDGRLRVEHVLADSPAEAAGVAPGDELVALGGVRLDPATWESRIAALPPRTRTDLALFRRDALLVRTVTLGEAPPASYRIIPAEDTEDSRLLREGLLGPGALA